ncbi:hypothetical protein [Pontibaca salina]|uniref:Uncharacterized protein n=1 Tax=Pontibaca salina TaxID=2795731 RepID=A0A934M2U1_9RHOB|nr:hypothetical protein [Pontibaca salina]MBI6629159.1 hypothetical protein [Pontibaca salina]
MRFPILLLVLALLPFRPLYAADPFDLIFRTGTLSDVPAAHQLTYARTVSVPANPQMEQAGTGRIVLSLVPDDMAQLDFQQGDQHRIIGRFPATVGNPMIMYFFETVINDVAQNTGGSPYYIRNRIKDALREPTEIKEFSAETNGQNITAQQITLRPLKGDRNNANMQGYDDLTLTVTVSDDAPGWYTALVAEVPGDPTTPPLYHSALALTDAGAAQ